jgi:hypothetical protein
MKSQRPRRPGSWRHPITASDGRTSTDLYTCPMAASTTVTVVIGADIAIRFLPELDRACGAGDLVGVNADVVELIHSL